MFICLELIIDRLQVYAVISYELVKAVFKKKSNVINFNCYYNLFLNYQ